MRWMDNIRHDMNKMEVRGTGQWKTKNEVDGQHQA